MKSDVALTKEAPPVEALLPRLIEQGVHDSFLWRLFCRMFHRYYKAIITGLTVREERAALAEMKNTLWEENLLSREASFKQLSEETLKALEGERTRAWDEVSKARKIARRMQEHLEELIPKRDRLQGRVVELETRIPEVKRQLDEATKKLADRQSEFCRREQILHQSLGAEASLSFTRRTLMVTEQTLLELNQSLAHVRSELTQLEGMRDQAKQAVVSMDPPKDLAKPPSIYVSYEDVMFGVLPRKKIPDVITLTERQFLDLFPKDAGEWFGAKDSERWGTFINRVDALAVLKKGEIRIDVGEYTNVPSYMPEILYQRIKNGGKTNAEIRIEQEAQRLSEMMK